MKKGRILAFAALALAATSALATDVSGSWNGKFDVDFAAMEKMMAGQMAKATAEQKQMVKSQLAMVKNMMGQAVFKLTINKDGTYKMVTPAMMNQKSQTEAGTWKLSGSSITMTSSNPQNKGPKNITGKLSANGKSIVFDMSAEAKKRANGQPVPSTKIVFSKA